MKQNDERTSFIDHYRKHEYSTSIRAADTYLDAGMIPDALDVLLGLCRKLSRRSDAPVERRFAYCGPVPGDNPQAK